MTRRCITLLVAVLLATLVGCVSRHVVVHPKDVESLGSDWNVSSEPGSSAQAEHGRS